MPYSSESERGFIVALHTLGLSSRRIAARPEVHLSRSQVNYWISRWRGDGNWEGMAGFEALKTKPKTGRPRVEGLSVMNMDLIVASIMAMCKRPLTAVIREILPDLMPHITTIYKRLHKEYGLYDRVPAKKPALSAEQKAARLMFAMENIDKPIQYWRSVLWTDEKTFRSDANGQLHCWRRNGTRYESEHVVEVARSGHVTAQFWGAVSWHHGAVAFVSTSPHLNSEEYVGVMGDTMLPAVEARIGQGTPFIFMHDNASIHTARLTRQWFTERPQIEVLYWPANSPDLNPIEHVWAMMAVNWDCRREATRAALQDHTTDVWGTVERRLPFVQCLCDSMPHRLQAVIDAEGGHTSY